MNEPQTLDQPIRSRGWVASHPKTVVLVSLLLIVVLSVFMLDRWAQSRFRQQIEAIRRKGEPVSVQDIIDGLPRIPNEENMAFLIGEQIRNIEAFPLLEETKKLLPVVGYAERGPTGRRLPPAQLATARWFLAKFPEELAGIHQALQLESGCGEVRPAETPTFLIQPALSNARLATKTLAVELLVATEDQDSIRAGEILSDMCRVYRMLDHGVDMESTLVRLAVDEMAASYTEQAINLCALDGETLRRLQAAFGAKDPCLPFKKALLDEKARFIDLVRLLQTGQTIDVEEDGSVKRNWWSHIPIVSALDAAEAVELYQATVDLIEQPDLDAVRLLRSTEPPGTKPRPYSSVACFLFPSFARSAQLCLRTAGMNRAIIAALACERYRLLNQDWPTELQILVPDYLRAVPIDPFDDKPIRYRRIPEGICVWTIGEDLVDNGGDVMRLSAPKSGRRSPDFGWVLLNPELRGLPADETAPTTAPSP
ncbi:MAG TPA: hypothetical protein VMV94_08715 [Phycisphaerae bacterium]|nr:hypothetical protein [Phycisphaerae bacterium]